MMRCVMIAVGMITVSAFGDDWPQWRGPMRDGVWRESGVIDRFDGRKLKILWRASISSGYSGPTVANGRVYVTDRVVEPEQVERVHCLDARTGKTIWLHEYSCAYRGIGYDAGPRASVTVHDSRAYSLGATGRFFCFDAATGKIHWEKDLKKSFSIEMPIWGIAAAPLIENDLVILQIGGSPDACLVAFDRHSGELRWRSLSDKASYSAPRVYDFGGTRVMICYTGDNVAGLDPRTGKVFWKYPFPPRRMVIGIADPVVDGDRLFITNFFDGSLMLRLTDDGRRVEKLWQTAGEDEKNTKALHSIITTPIMKDGYIYGVDSYGELRCLRAEDGQRIWEDLSAVPRARWATIHMVENGKTTWMFNEQGDLLITELSPGGFHEIDRASLISPTLDQLRQRRGLLVPSGIRESTRFREE